MKKRVEINSVFALKHSLAVKDKFERILGPKNDWSGRATQVTLYAVTNIIRKIDRPDTWPLGKAAVIGVINKWSLT